MRNLGKKSSKINNMEGRKCEGKLKEENRRKNRKKRKEWKESEEKIF